MFICFVVNNVILLLCIQLFSYRKFAIATKKH